MNVGCLRRIFSFFFNGFILLLILGFGLLWYLRSDFNQPFDKKELAEFKQMIRESEPLPQDFVEIYKKVHPIVNTSVKFSQEVFGNYDGQCPCLRTAWYSQMFGDNTQGKMRVLTNGYVLSWKLERQFTQEECLSFEATYFDFLENQRGIRAASKHYFKKDLKELNFDEMATLAIMMENPWLYHPRRQPTRLKERLEEVKRKNNKQ